MPLTVLLLLVPRKFDMESFYAHSAVNSVLSLINFSLTQVLHSCMFLGLEIFGVSIRLYIWF